MRISAVTDLFIKKFAAGGIILASSYSKNVIYDKYPDSGNWFATQRPGVNIFEDVSATGVTDARGRGVYYWNDVSASYVVNNGTVYKSSYAGPNMSITAGVERCYLFEIGDFLVIIDPENNQGWTIDSAASTTIVEITDIAFPPKQTPALQLAKGGSVINGKLYLITTDGDIYESAINDPTSWNTLNVLNAEIERDGGVYLGEHHQHVVAMGTRTLEFFYDGKNPTGSTLNARTDIDYGVGAVDENSFWEENDLIFWVGKSPSSGIGVYILERFQPRKISKPNLDTFLNSAITTDNVKLLGSGFQIGGHIYYLLTLHNFVSTILPETTLVYDATADRWYWWELEQAGIKDFPLVAWTKSTGTRIGLGILSNGDLISIADDNNPQDTIEASSVFEPDVFIDGVFTNTAAAGTNITMSIVTGYQDMGTRLTKFQSSLKLVGVSTDTIQSMTVEMSDEADDNFIVSRTIDTQRSGEHINSLGSFTTRNYRMTYSGTEQYRFEGIETSETAGTT